MKNFLEAFVAALLCCASAEAQQVNVFGNVNSTVNVTVNNPLHVRPIAPPDDFYALSNARARAREAEAENWLLQQRQYALEVRNRELEDRLRFLPPPAVHLHPIPVPCLRPTPGSWFAGRSFRDRDPDTGRTRYWRLTSGTPFTAPYPAELCGEFFRNYSGLLCIRTACGRVFTDP